MKNNFNFFLIFFILINFVILPVKSDSKLDIGKEVFLTNCSACHILADAGSEGQIGPNLNEIRPDIKRVIYAVTNGIGVMPSFEGQITSDEIDAVSYYVSINVEK